MKSVGIIPARYASTRFPGKPLAIIDGKLMIERVYEQCLKSALDLVVVATDDDRIAQAVHNFGGKAMLTSPLHPSGTDRCGETAQKLHLENQDIIINIQGDEPFIQPEEINALVHLFQNKEIQIATLISEIKELEKVHDPNVVKALIRKDRSAIYFSRLPVPFQREANAENIVYHRHIGIYAYTNEVLQAIIKLPESMLEKSEKLEQLRWIENGYRIHTADCNHIAIAIDTPQDLQTANLYIQNTKL